MDDFDFVDVEGDLEGDGSRSVNSKKKDVLEEGKRILNVCFWFYLNENVINRLCFRFTIL